MEVYTEEEVVSFQVGRLLEHQVACPWEEEAFSFLKVPSYQEGDHGLAFLEVAFLDQA